MRKELHVSHIPQPPKPVIIPLSSKKKLKTKKKKTKKKKKKKTKKKKKNYVIGPVGRIQPWVSGYHYYNS